MTSGVSLFGRRSLLIADDDVNWRDTLCDILEPHGCELLVASDGPEVLELVDERPVDCLLLDMHMPTWTGLETLRRLRQREATLPCIFVTGDCDQQLVHQARVLAAYDVLRKPVTRDLLTRAVAGALRVLPS